ncbi:hypothetical protein [Muricoccus radiodurans]|uniref:hypothetical protein n=1 Tax=Muricoccus radiodurans TaxID=2231721 RepID=UPI003CE885C1
MIHLALTAFLAAAGPDPGQAIQLAQQAEGPTAAPARPAVRRQRPRRRAITRAQPPIQPLPAPAAPAPVPQADLAPMPDRSIEPPRGPRTAEGPRLRPDLIDPRSLPDSRRQSVDDFNDRHDRFARNPAAGARLDIPFSY